jgi:hypothetical protein
MRIQLPSNKTKRYVHIQKDVKKKSAHRKWERGKKSPRGREGRDSSDG